MVSKLDLITFAKRKDVAIAAASLLSFSAGTVTTFFVAKKRLEAKYVAISEQEIAEAKEFYSVLNKQGGLETPESAVEYLSAGSENEFAQDPSLVTAAEALSSYAGEEVVEVTETVTIQETITPVKHNIFEKGTVTPFNADREIPRRTRDIPYVITADEYLSNEDGRTQVTLTYYNGGDDDVVVDEKEDVVRDPDPLIGTQFMENFGYGSNDRNTVYIRNDKLDLDFEVILDNRDYVSHVLGMGSFQHSDTRQRRYRIRGDDE